MKNTILILLFSTCLIFGGSAQDLIVSGTVTDQNGEAIPFANIYINNTSIGTVSDLNGFYKFQTDLKGNQQIICSFTGFETQYVIKDLSPGKSISQNFILSEDIAFLGEVSVDTEKPKSWKKNLKRFENSFLGRDKASNSCTIVNAYVIDFSTSKSGILSAEAFEPLIIENRNLGYELQYDLKSFWVHLATGTTEYKGLVYYKPMKPTSDTEASKWKKNRNAAYYGSSAHFFSSLVNDQLKENDFILYEDQTDLKKLTPLLKDNTKEITLSEIKTGNDSSTINIANRHFLRVEYIKRKEYAIVNNRTENYNQTSWIDLKKNELSIDESGALLDPLAAVFYGFFSTSNIATSLPIDFSPNSSLKPKAIAQEENYFLKNLLKYDTTSARESLFLNFSENSLFIPGSNIEFELLLGSFTDNPNGTYSEVAYVELIGPSCEPILLRTIKLTEGRGRGSFVFPANAYPGRYTVRAYTNWMINYSPELYFQQSIDLSNNKSYEPTSVEFFPELKNLFAGQQNNLYLKTLDRNQQPTSGFIRIFSGSGKIIKETTSDKNGLAKISNFDPRKYPNAFAKINDQKTEWDFPSYINARFEIQIIDAGNSINLLLKNKEKKTNVFFVIAESNDQVSLLKEYTIGSKKSIKIEIEKTTLDGGLNLISILDPKYDLIAQKPIKIIKESNFESKDDLQNKAENFFKWYGSFEGSLSDSEIVSAPSNLFIATHHWKSLDHRSIYEDRFKEKKLQKESGLTISGKIDLFEGRKIQQGDNINLYVRSKKPAFHLTNVERDGFFKFTNINFTDTTDLIFTFNNLLAKDFELKFDTVRTEKAFRSISNLCVEKIDNPDTSSNTQKLVFENGSILLDEVTVSTRRKVKTIYKTPTKSFDFETSQVQTNAIASGGLLEFLRTRLGAARLLKDIYTGEITGIIIGGMTSLSKFRDQALLLYDGIQISAVEFNALDPATVGRIDVLRGTDAALFGTRGSGGVIIAYPPEDYAIVSNKSKRIRLIDGFDVVNN